MNLNQKHIMNPLEEIDDSAKLLSRFENDIEIAISSSDPGGANLLATWAKKNQRNYKYFLNAESIKIFQEKTPGIEYSNKVNEISQKILFSNIGWKSNFEFNAINQVICNGGKVAIFLDHYDHFIECLTRLGKTVIPDWIVAFDDLSEKNARRDFPISEVFRIPNYYEIDIASKASVIRKNQALEYEYLYLTEPFDKSSPFNEYQILSGFFKLIDKSSFHNSRILIRVHPSETVSKYLGFIPSQFTGVEFSYGNPLEYDLAKSDKIIGAHTTALRIALRVTPKVYCSLPDISESSLSSFSLLPLSRLREETF